MNPTWNSGATYVPPSYSEATSQHASLGGGLTFVDFIPECLSSGGFFSKPVYQNFRTLINSANQWLLSNPDQEVKTCESVELKTRREVSNSEKMTYIEYGEHQTTYIRGLRLWLVPQLDRSRPPQKIGYINLLPAEKEHGVFSTPVFESLDEVLQKFNSAVNTNPIPGRILTVESQEMKVSNYSGLDPDRSYWSEYGDSAKLFLVVLRVFYEQLDSAGEEIGIADFIPNKIEEGGIFSQPRFEPFSCVVNKASQWCANQSGLRFCNAQSMEVKMKSGHSVDTQKMSYTEHGNRRTRYVRILRVAYAKLLVDMDQYSPVVTPPSLHLTCKTFVPLRLTRGVISISEFESLSKTRSRIQAWIKATGARVLSAETAAMRLFTGGEAREGVEAGFTYNNSEGNEHWIFVIRVYLDGIYQEPPSEVLPPIPVIEDTNCCSIL